MEHGLVFPNSVTSGAARCLEVLAVAAVIKSFLAALHALTDVT
jgi:hypothetical protein